MPTFRSHRALVTAALVLVASIPFLGIGCGGGKDDNWDHGRSGPKVVVSFAPIYCFAANVAGGDAQVKNVMTSTGPHDFNPTDKEARLLQNADFFFINGLGLDDALADTIKRGSGNKKLKVVDLGSLIPDDKLLTGEDHDHAGHAHHHHGHDHGNHDPHIWLSPEMARLMTEGIRDELKAADGANAAKYEARSAEYVAKLNALQADGVAMLKAKKDRKLVTFHESLGYFAKAFDLEVAGVVEKKPGVEPNINETNELIKMCLEKKVRLIAVEPQYGSNTSAKAILDSLRRAGIADAALVEIDPLETVPPSALTPEWYEQKMRSNLEALRDAMK
ncbi:MAG TPA: metal ABC transporter substrate-binding protein [Urbifossiella sp.]|jgi:ABC-type Zn uptake system ZnuABC Zn-binding protein ZnuA